MAEGVWTGVEEVLNKLDNLADDIIEQLGENLQDAAEHLETAVRENITLTDHSLSDLAEMGHPYSKVKTKNIHSPDWLVHTQSGEMARSLKHDYSATEKRLLARVGFDGTMKGGKTAKHVIFGTSRMVGRDVLNGTLNQEEQKLREIIGKVVIKP